MNERLRMLSAWEGLCDNWDGAEDGELSSTEVACVILRGSILTFRPS